MELTANTIIGLGMATALVICSIALLIWVIKSDR